MMADLSELADGLAAGRTRVLGSALEGHSASLGTPGQAAEKKATRRGGGGSLEGGVLRCYVISEGEALALRRAVTAYLPRRSQRRGSI